MVFWILAIVVTAAACGTLYYAAVRRPVNAPADTATNAHFRLQLKELDADFAAGRLGSGEAQAARGEIAREVLRMQQEYAGRGEVGDRQRRGLLVAIAATVIIAFAGYAVLGQPDLPAQPLASRTVPPPALELDAAVARIETQLASTPDDLRGWTVVAPAYMQLGRFADAENAYRRVLELGGPTADGQTDLGEAVMMARGGVINEEALELFRSAAALDPDHVRSRFYLAGEATRAGAFDEAIAQWNEVLALAVGGEPWVATAREGLAAAQAGLAGDAAGPDQDAIAGMVDGLAARLATEGGSIEEWTRLVRSRLVLGQTAEAQSAYDAAREAYPEAAGRAELDVLAVDSGLVATGADN